MMKVNHNYTYNMYMMHVLSIKKLNMPYSLIFDLHSFTHDDIKIKIVIWKAFQHWIMVFSYYYKKL